MRTEHSGEVSAGGIVVADADGLEYVALVGAFDGGWVLPKGHVQPGESLEAAAFREVSEEAGLAKSDLRIVKYLGAFEFNEHFSSTRSMKKNHFFLMRLLNAGLPPLRTDAKHATAEWHSLPLRGQNMVYGYQKRLLDEVCGLNSANPGTCQKDVSR